MSFFYIDYIDSHISWSRKHNGMMHIPCNDDSSMTWMSSYISMTRLSPFDADAPYIKVMLICQWSQLAHQKLDHDHFLSFFMFPLEISRSNPVFGFYTFSSFMIVYSVFSCSQQGFFREIFWDWLTNQYVVWYSQSMYGFYIHIIQT